MNSHLFTFLSVIFLVTACTKDPKIPEKVKPEPPEVVADLPTDITQCSDKDIKVLIEIDKANPKLELFKDKNPKEWKIVAIQWVKDEKGKYWVKKLSVNEKSIPQENVLVLELSKKNDLILDSLAEIKMSSAAIDKIIVKNQPALKSISLDGLKNASAKKVEIIENKVLHELSISGFSKLPELDLEDVNLEILKLKDLPLLEEFSPKVQIKSLIFEGDLSALNYVYLTSKEIEKIQFSETKLPQLQYLTLNKNNLKEISITGMPKLETLNVRNNMLNKASITDCPALKNLDLGMNKDLTSIVLNGLNSLSTFDISETSITKFSTKDFPALKRFNAKGALISSIDLTGSAKLEILNLQSNKLTKIDLSPCKKMEMLLLDTNMLEQLDIPYIDPEGRVQVKHNRLVSLSFSKGVNGSLDELEIEDNRLHYTELKKIKEQAKPGRFLYGLQQAHTKVDETKKQIDASEYKALGIAFVVQKANGEEWDSAPAANYMEKEGIYTFLKAGKYRVIAKNVPDFPLFNWNTKPYSIGELSL